ncbi:MAG: hypothetical protein WBJ41_02690 [Chromatiaceae bacterium]
MATRLLWVDPEPFVPGYLIPWRENGWLEGHDFAPDPRGRQGSHGRDPGDPPLPLR